jgi:hypothetical protein
VGTAGTKSQLKGKGKGVSGSVKGKGKSVAGIKGITQSRVVYVGDATSSVAVFAYDQQVSLLAALNVGRLYNFKQVQARNGQVGQLFLVEHSIIESIMEAQDAVAMRPRVYCVDDFHTTASACEHVAVNQFTDLVLRVATVEVKQTAGGEEYLQLHGHDLGNQVVGPLRMWRFRSVVLRCQCPMWCHCFAWISSLCSCVCATLRHRAIYDIGVLQVAIYCLITSTS